jgi:hypothetical protein
LGLPSRESPGGHIGIALGAPSRVDGQAKTVLQWRLRRNGEGVLHGTIGTMKRPHLLRLRIAPERSKQGSNQPCDKQEVMMGKFYSGTPLLVDDKDPATGEYKSYSGYPLLVNDRDPEKKTYKSYSGIPLLVKDRDSKGEYRSYSGTPLLADDKDRKTGEYKSYSGTPVLVEDKDPKTGEYKSYSGTPLLVDDKDPTTRQYKSYSGYPVLFKR